MATKTKLVAGNWKMNGLRQDGAMLAHALKERAAVGEAQSCEILVCPPATLLSELGGILAGTGIGLGGQDCHAAVTLSRISASVSPWPWRRSECPRIT